MQSTAAIARPQRNLVLHVRAGFGHSFFLDPQSLLYVPGQDLPCTIQSFGIVGLGYAIDTRRTAQADLMLQTRPAPIGQGVITAIAQAEGFLQQAFCAARGTAIRVRPIELAIPTAPLARYAESWPGVIGVQMHQQKGLVILKQHIQWRHMQLDQSVFE